MQRIYVVGTADTKGEELAYVAARIRERGGVPLLVDIGTRGARIPVDITAAEIAAHGPTGLMEEGDRGTAVAGMAAAFADWIEGRSDIAGIIGIGGGGGTAMVTAGMLRLPIGVPKLMVSTLASGNVAPYVGVSDIVMMPAITDLAGLNRISRVVLAHAANAITAMAAEPPRVAGARPAVGLTMFGVTTPAVTEIAARLGERLEPVVFHATGTGGRTMEALVDAGLLSGLIDITTTEVCDLLVGGVLSAGPERLDCVARHAIPYVGSVGACDMVNFWAPETVPEQFRERLLYRHNPNVTLMRTTPEECRAIGSWIGDKLSQARGPVTVLLPLHGVSALDAEGQPFFDPWADAALFDALEAALQPGGNRQVRRLPCHINDPAFAAAAAEAYLELAFQE